jgi:regulator of cell morphogenesis and NO signaling
MNLIQTETIGDIAARRMAAVRVFEEHGIDYCCGGGRPLDEVCREKGISPVDLLAEVSATERSRPESGTDWLTAPLSDLTAHIVATHHQYLRRELPALAVRLAAVIDVHGQRHGDLLIPLAKAFADLKSELEPHMHKEETVLFPFVEWAERSMQGGRRWTTPPFGGFFASPIRTMEQEHDSAGRALLEIRRITGDFTLPLGACNTFRSLYDGLAKLERDLHVHIHLENNVLFPRAMQLEIAARS